MEPNTNLSKVLDPLPPGPSGMLLKYTNYVKGYQMRYFTVDATQGILNYYLCEGPEENPQPVLTNQPRGQVHLVSAVICPSEDSRTFLINCANGEIIKLRAQDARSRQEWVDGLRSIVQSHSQALQSLSTSKSPISVRDSLAAFNAIDGCRQQLQQTETCNANLIKEIENLGNDDSEAGTSSEQATGLTHIDPDCLMLKALSATTTTVLFQSLGLLQKYNEYQNTEDI